MAQKIACPKCGEANYEGTPVCWACGAPLTGPRAVGRGTPEERAPNPPETSMPDMGPGGAGMTAETAQVDHPPEAAPTVTEPQAQEMNGTVETAEAAPTEESGITDAGPEVIAAPSNGPKPADIEAKALRDKEYVTPPVDVEERPRSVGEWIAYGIQAVRSSVEGFRASLDDYDRRRGHKSGTMSSFGCLVTTVTAAITIALIIWILSFAVSRLGL